MRNKVIIGIILIMSILSSSVGFVYGYNEEVTITLNGEESINLNLKEEYKELGATAKSCSINHCTDITDNLVINGKIDTSKIGKYKVVYKVNYRNETYVKERIVSVVDNVPPSIKLKGKKTVNMCPNKKYKEKGYEALDNYDGDITKKVIVENNKDGITYKVLDSSNNEATAFRKINRVDTSKPVIKLKGSKTITLKLNDKYVEYGVTVKDNCGKISLDKVEIKSNVDTSKAGTYKVKYTVKDSAGNAATVTRTVKVKKPITFNTNNKNEYIESLEKYIKQKNYKVSIGYVNLRTGYTYLYNENKIYYGASLVKTVDALYVYEKMNFDEATRQKVEKAISKSDNTAHKQLVNLIGIDKLRAYGRKIGARNFLTGSNKDYYGNTTVKDQIKVWKYVYKFINKNSKGKELKQYFINDFYNSLLFDGIPTTMHKYGYYSNYYHDTGIVYSKDPYIVVILTRHGKGNYKAVVQDLSKKIYGLNKIDK